MSVTKPKVWYEFTRDIRSLGGNSLDVRMKLYYDVGGKIIAKRYNFTIHAEDENELEQRIDECWQHYRPNNPAESLIERLKGKKKAK